MFSNLIYKMVPNYKFIYAGKNIELPNIIKTRIQNYWNELIESGKKYTNGKIYTISNISLDDNDCLIFRIGETNFAHYLYTVKMNFQGEYICRSIAASALFLTNDNYYVLGKMSSDTSLAGKIKFIGGAISKEDFIRNEFQPIECIKREVKEEIGLDLNNKVIVENMQPSCFITRKNLSFINICFKVKLNLSSNQVVALFNEHNVSLKNQNIEQEINSIILLKNQKNYVLEFLSDNEKNTIDYMKDLFLVELGIHQALSFLDKKNVSQRNNIGLYD